MWLNLGFPWKDKIMGWRYVSRWPIYLIGLSWTIPMVRALSRFPTSSQCFLREPWYWFYFGQTPETNYLTLTLRSLGFNTFQTNLLVIPAYVLFILQLLFWTWISEKYNQRFFIGLVSQLWAIPLIVALETLPKIFPNASWSRYAISSLIVGYPYAHAMLGTLKTPEKLWGWLLIYFLLSVAITSRNAGTVRTRTVGSSLYNMAVQTSNIISSQVSSNFRWSSSGLAIFSHRRAANRSIGMTTNRSTAEAIKSSWALPPTIHLPSSELNSSMSGKTSKQLANLWSLQAIGQNSDGEMID